MKNSFKIFFGVLALLVIVSSCKKTNYTLGDLTPPANVVINTTVAGQDATHPNGDGSGVVNIAVTSDYALAYKIRFDDNTDSVYVPTGSVSHKYTTTGLHTYNITAYVYGKGGSYSTASKSVTVQSDFTPDPTLVTNLTNDGSKTWVLDAGNGGHFGVGPWDVNSIKPQWYAAGPNEKASCCACFYSASFTFTKTGTGFTLTSTTPDGAYTKTGSLTTLPGIPSTGGEACYSYGGGTSAFTLVPASSGAPAVAATGSGNSNSTQTSILLAGVNTFIGYGAVLKEYEILTISSTIVYLRVQGTETGNAWYIRLKAL